MSIVNVKGTLELSNCINSDIDEIVKVVNDSNINATIEDDVIFFDNTFDNSQNFAESFALFVAHKLPIGHEEMRLVVVGETIVDRYDIIIRNNKVLLQYYDLIPGDIEEYIN